jgi:hypothetical protein
MAAQWQAAADSAALECGNSAKERLRHCGPLLSQSYIPWVIPIVLVERQNPTAIYLLRLPVMGTLKRYSKALEYEYRVKTVALGTLKRYSILSLTLYLEWYGAYSILYSGGAH